MCLRYSLTSSSVHVCTMLFMNKWVNTESAVRMELWTGPSVRNMRRSPWMFSRHSLTSSSFHVCTVLFMNKWVYMASAMSCHTTTQDIVVDWTFCEEHEEVLLGCA